MRSSGPKWSYWLSNKNQKRSGKSSATEKILHRPRTSKNDCQEDPRVAPSSVMVDNFGLITVPTKPANSAIAVPIRPEQRFQLPLVCR